MPATQLVSRHCDPPHASYATRRPGTAGPLKTRQQNLRVKATQQSAQEGTIFIHDMCIFRERLEALQRSV